MDVSKYLTIQEAADALHVTRAWVYHLAKTYGWRREVVLGKKVFLKKDVMKTPNAKQRRSEAQHRRYHTKKSGISPVKN